MFTHTSPVLPEHVSVIGGTLDPTAPGRGAHLTFDRILGRCGEAWMAFLGDLGGFGVEIICPRVEIDYLSEVGAGDLVIDVVVVSVGRTSFRLGLAMAQHDKPVATAEVVLVAFDYTAGTSVALTDPQRAALQNHLPE
ncbi:MAG TPA: thioesterase family protein [Mycobacteriales bacterium]|nr:thioesterase family protein [Mycobacteriales bacterium]